MQYFLKLIEMARLNGVLVTDKDQKPRPREANEYFWNVVESAQPFVFSRWTESKTGIDWQTPDGTYACMDLDAPFKVFSIETLDERGLVNLPQNDVHTAFCIRCILVLEMAPRHFGFYTLLEINGQFSVYSSNSEGNIVQAYIERMNKEQMGLQNVREVVKVGSGKNKRTHRIRKLIYVCPKKDRDESKMFGSREVDWTHRFLVRGHWRTLAGGLGKDREGQYCVNGFTWVTEHERGPEDLPLITKTRIVR